MLGRRVSIRTRNKSLPGKVFMSLPSSQFAVVCILDCRRKVTDQQLSHGKSFTLFACIWVSLKHNIKVDSSTERLRAPTPSCQVCPSEKSGKKEESKSFTRYKEGLGELRPSLEATCPVS